MGRLLYFVGIVMSAFAITLKLVEGTPTSLSFMAIPLIITGIILLIASNFFREKGE